MGPALGGSAPAAADPIIYINDSYVGFIEAAVPRNMFSLRFDGNYNNRQPTRAEFIQPNNKLGFPMVETKLDTFDMTTYAEYAINTWLSTFVEAPYRWVNPEVNQNGHGMGDMKYGFKLCTWTSERFIATILGRVYQPTGGPIYGTDHWSVEPGLLAAFRYNENILIEGQVTYWIPINGGDFAGEVLRYGIGVSYGRRNPGGVWWMPVAEMNGWTVMNGKTIVADSPDSYLIRDAHGQTILNGYIGIRWGYGSRMDMYAGYGRAFTGEAWARDMVRVEFRYLF